MKFELSVNWLCFQAVQAASMMTQELVKNIESLRFRILTAQHSTVCTAQYKQEYATVV